MAEPYGRNGDRGHDHAGSHGGPANMPATPEECPTCSFHPLSPAAARCVGCGRLLCVLCRVLVGNRNYCKTCATAALAPAVYPAPAVPVRPARPREIVFPGCPWGVGEALLVFFIALTISVLFGMVIYSFLLSIASVETAHVALVFFSSVALYALLLGGTYFSVEKRHGSSLASIGIKAEGLGRGVAWGAGLGIPLFFAALLLAYVSQLVYNPIYRSIFDRNPSDQIIPRVSSSGMSPFLWLVLIVTLVILAPVCEEIFFRGYFYPALRNRMGMQAAMVLNGLIFAAVHFDVAGFFPRFLLGYGLCYFYEKNRTLAAPIVGHAMYNGLVLVLFGVLRIF